MRVDLDQQLEDFQIRLKRPEARERMLAASEMSDWFEYGRDLPEGFHRKMAEMLIEAALVETDEDPLEAILNAVGSGTCYRNLSPEIPWRKIGDFLPQLKSPLLEYGLGILGECRDPAMCRYIEAYTNSPTDTVREEALRALDVMRSRTQQL